MILLTGLVVSAAITDLGFIRWKKDVTNLKAKNQFKFSGLNMLDVLMGQKQLMNLGQDMLDSLKNSFTVSNSKASFYNLSSIRDIIWRKL